MNLLQETLEDLHENGKRWEDIEWIGTEDAKIPLKDFLREADFEYDNGYGGARINTNLTIVGKDWWLMRHEYDGSEWWEFQTKPVEPPLINNSGSLLREEY